MPAYDSAKSLQCANCHGADAGGGAATFTLTPDAQGDPNAHAGRRDLAGTGAQHVMYRFNECTTDELADEGARTAPGPRTR